MELLLTQKVDLPYRLLVWFSYGTRALIDAMQRMYQVFISNQNFEFT